jgi:cell division protein FtsW
MVGTKQKMDAPDFPLFLLATVLVCVGLIMVYSASAIMAADKFGNSGYFVLRQALWLCVGAPVLWAASRMDLERWRPYAVPALFVGLFLMLLVCVPGLGVSAGGAKRWLRLGPLSFQPSEAMKLILAFFLADSLVRRRERLQTPKGLVSYLVVLGVSIGILQLQHDFGSVVIFCVLTLTLLFLAGVRLSFFLLPAAALLPVLAFLVMSSSYRMKRITAFLNPWDDPLGSGFQLIQSLIAVGSGGPFGVGLSNSTQKLFYLPAPHTDFIFAIIGEELGLWGALGVLVVFALFAARGLQVAAAAARRTDGQFDALLAAGLTGLIAFQAILNLGVVTGLLPTKGLPLPLVSYGGTSLVFTLFGVGLLLNVSRRAKLHGTRVG